MFFDLSGHASATVAGVKRSIGKAKSKGDPSSLKETSEQEDPDLVHDPELLDAWKAAYTAEPCIGCFLFVILLIMFGLVVCKNVILNAEERQDHPK